MIKERTNLLVMGTLASGSSALIDMLYEYQNINVLRYEFNDYRRPGFVNDQLTSDNSIDYPNVIEQKIKFTNKRWEMIFQSSIWKLIPDKLLEFIWEKDFSSRKLRAYKNSLTELFQVVFLLDLSRALKSDISYDEKIRLSNLWIRRVGSIFPDRYDFTLFNQPLHPWFDPEIWTKVFEPFKLICVYRDPKDQIAEMVRRDIAFSPFRCSKLSYGQFNIASIYGNDRKGRLKFLIDSLAGRNEKLDKWAEVIEPGKILFVDFEGLVNNYDAWESRLERFIGNISGRHTVRKKYFDPENARKRAIGIYRNYLHEDELKSLTSLEAWYKKRLDSEKSLQPA